MFRSSQAVIPVFVALVGTTTVVFLLGRPRQGTPQPHARPLVSIESRRAEPIGKPLVFNKPQLRRIVEGNYTVAPGDTLWTIHGRLKIRMEWWRPDNSGWWPVVVVANPKLRDCKGKRLVSGQELLLVDLVRDYPMD